MKGKTRTKQMIVATTRSAPGRKAGTNRNRRHRQPWIPEEQVVGEGVEYGWRPVRVPWLCA